jgi:hypothetical protein
LLKVKENEMKRFTLIIALLIPVAVYSNGVFGAVAVKHSFQQPKVISHYWYRNTASPAFDGGELGVCVCNGVVRYRRSITDPLDGADCPKDQNGDECRLLMFVGNNSVSGEFVYQVTMTTDSPKKIRAVKWDYIFSDSITLNQLTRNSFTTEQRIPMGATATLISKSTRPPTGVVAVEMLSRRVANTYEETVQVRKIKYSDGSEWNAPED